MFASFRKTIDTRQKKHQSAKKAKMDQIMYIKRKIFRKNTQINFSYFEILLRQQIHPEKRKRTVWTIFYNFNYLNYSIRGTDSQRDSVTITDQCN